MRIGGEWSCISGLSTSSGAVVTQVVDTTPSSGFSSAQVYTLDVFALVLREVVIKDNRVGMFITV